jgi:hypothetical protein
MLAESHWAGVRASRAKRRPCDLAGRCALNARPGKVALGATQAGNGCVEVGRTAAIGAKPRRSALDGDCVSRGAI